MGIRRDFLPSRESELVTWSVNFAKKITAAPETYGLTAAQAAEYAARHEAFAAAYQTANNPQTRSPSNIIRKNGAMKALVAWARTLSRLVQATPGVTDSQRTELGLSVRAATTAAIPVPVEAPRLAVVAAAGQTVSLQLSIAGTTTRRGRPRHVAGATIFSYVGPVAPPDLAQWTIEANQTKTRFNIHFPAHIKPGTTVWFTARWFNPHAQAGPMCNPIHTNLPGGGIMPFPNLFALAA